MDERKPGFGNLVYCTAYIKPSGHHYEVKPMKYSEEDYPECYFWAAGAEEGIPVEDFHMCSRFKTIKKNFAGICVGATRLNTIISAEYCDNQYGYDFFRTESLQPAEFAVVYYSPNKKRIVPMDAIEVVRRDAYGE